jgi:hypothetical protein
MSEPLRRVEGDTLVSTATPAMRLRVEPSMPYLESTELIIKGIARAERHYFVDARDGEVRRMLVAQFEGFLDDNDERYRYPLPDPIGMGGETWGSWVFAYALSDGEAPETRDTIEVMERQGLTIEDELVMARYARILEPEARHEVLFFYTEPLRRLGHSLASASVDGELRPEYTALGVDLRARARRAFRVIGDAGGG